MTTLPTAAEIIEQRVASRLAGETVDQAPRPPASARSTASVLAERLREDADQLASFVETIAAHFACPSLANDEIRVRLQPAFRELRAMAHRLNAEAERRDADPTAPAPGRDASGRFAPRRG